MSGENAYWPSCVEVEHQIEGIDQIGFLRPLLRPRNTDLDGSTFLSATCQTCLSDPDSAATSSFKRPEMADRRSWAGSRTKSGAWRSALMLKGCHSA